MKSAETLMLRNALLADGRLVDVTIIDDLVTAVGPAGVSADPTAPGTVTDLAGSLLIGAFAEPHLHLDKVFTAGRATADGTLTGAMSSYQNLLDVPRDDILRRARTAIAELVRSGVTAVRAQVGCGRLAGIRFIEAITEARSGTADLIDIQIVAHLGGPAPDGRWREHLPLLHAALDAGADVVGGTPSIDPRPEEALDALLQVAVDRRVPVDLHLDETTDPDVFLLGRLAALAPTSIPVTASHCVSLGVQPAGVIARTAEEMAHHDISVVTLPATNLYLQGRGSMLRGLPPVAQLLAAGVLVAAGGDNVQDPFHPAGRFDPLDTAALLVEAAHLDPATAQRLVGPDARRLLGLPPAGPTVGARADLVALEVPAEGDPLAQRGVGRRVWRAGREISRTERVDTGPIQDWLIAGQAHPSRARAATTGRMAT